MSSHPRKRAQDRLAARIACTACRRLKMRCVGAETPPCLRCLKAGRQCVIQPAIQAVNPVRRSRQNLEKLCMPSNSNGPSEDDLDNSSSANQINPIVSASSGAIDILDQSNLRGNRLDPAGVTSSNDSDGRASTSPRDTLAGPHGRRNSYAQISEAQSFVAAPHPQTTGLPSVYSRSPNEVVQSCQSDSAVNPSQTQDAGPELQHRHSHFTQHETYGKAPDDGHVLDLLTFFNERLLHNLPFLLNDTIGDTSSLLQTQRPLVYCAAFVAARFVPGYKKVRCAMIPEINQILKQKYHPIDIGHHDRAWSLLQAFAILYAYVGSESTAPDPCSNGELSRWALKDTVEMYASRLSLYKSAEELRHTRNTETDRSIQSIALRRYVFWLWLYTMSHYTSLLLRMPPTIVVDINIQAAPKLILGLTKDKRALRILAEVELCLLWTEIGMLDQAANQWWCTPIKVAKATDTLSTIDRFKIALKKWLDHWVPANGAQITTTRDSGAISFHYWFTRFSISTYATRLIHQRGGTASPNSPLIVRGLLQSIEAAADCCTFFQCLSPLQRDRTRYIADAGFTMIAFPCFYIISAAEILSEANVSMDGHLNNVRIVAELLVESAADEYHSPRVFGKKILAKLASTTASMTSTRSARNSRTLSTQQVLYEAGVIPSDTRALQDTLGLPEQYPSATEALSQNLRLDEIESDSFPQHPYQVTSDDWFLFDTSLEAAADSMFTFDNFWNS